MAESRQVETQSVDQAHRQRDPESASPTADGPLVGVAASGYQHARLDPRNLSPGALLALQRTAGNHAVNALLHDFSARQSAARTVSVQRDDPAGGASTPAPAVNASPPVAPGGTGGSGSAQSAQLQLPPPAPQQVPADQLAAAEPSDAPGSGGRNDASGSGGGHGSGDSDPDTGEVDLVRTTTNARTGEHTIDFTANFHVPAFHLPAFHVLGREVQPFDDQSVFIQMSFDPSREVVPGTSISYSQIHSTLVGVSTSALNAHIFSLHGREFFDIALPVSLGVQNDVTGASVNAQAGIQAAVNVTRAIAITATFSGQATVPMGGGPATISFAGGSVGVAGKF